MTEDSTPGSEGPEVPEVVETADGFDGPEVPDLPETADGSGGPGTADGSEGPEAPATEVAALEQEGEIAADYLEGLLDILDLDGDLDLDVEGDRAAVAIVGTGLDHLVGPRGATLEALQELTRLTVLQETGRRSRLMLDIGGWRARRRDELVGMARECGARVRESGQAEALAAMTPFERKVVHDTVSELDGVVSESEGEEPQRRVVVRPA